MATGLTSFLTESNQPALLKQLAVRCASSFGTVATFNAFQDGEIDLTRIKPDTYHSEAVAKCRQRLAEYESRDDAAWQADLDEYYKTQQESISRGRTRVATNNAVFHDMIAKVERWTPPTSEHEQLKAFMLRQLHDSLSDPSFYEDLEVTDWSLEAYKKHTLADIRRTLTYHEEKDEEAQKWAEFSHNWCSQLLQSLDAFED